MIILTARGLAVLHHFLQKAVYGWVSKYVPIGPHLRTVEQRRNESDLESFVAARSSLTVEHVANKLSEFKLL